MKGNKTMRNYVTRLVKGTVAKVKTINKNTDEIATQDVIINRTFKEDDLPSVRKAVDKEFKDTDYVVVSVIEYAPISKLYGIPVSLFMENAVELDPETRKILATGEETTEV